MNTPRHVRGRADAPILAHYRHLHAADGLDVLLGQWLRIAFPDDGVYPDIRDDALCHEKR